MFNYIKLGQLKIYLKLNSKYVGVDPICKIVQTYSNTTSIFKAF